MKVEFKARFKGLEVLDKGKVRVLVEPVDILTYDNKTFFKVVVSDDTNVAKMLKTIKTQLPLDIDGVNGIVLLPLPKNKTIATTPKSSCFIRILSLLSSGQAINVMVADEELTKIEIA